MANGIEKLSLGLVTSYTNAAVECWSNSIHRIIAIIILIVIIVQTKIVEHVQVTYIDKHKNIYGTITISYELITEKIQAYLNN